MVLEQVKCNLCGSEDFTVKYSPLIHNYDPRKVFSASGGIRGTQQIVKCKNCGLIYVNPRLKEKFIYSAYENAKDELYISQLSAREKTFRFYWEHFEKYFPKCGRILDVGTATGDFLKVAKENGWKVFGVEPSKWLSGYGRKKLGINIFQGTLLKAEYPSNYFNVVTMWDMLEHSSDPFSEIKEAGRVMKKGGIIIVNYPDIGTLPAKLAGRKWWFLLSNHLYYFDTVTMKKMLKKAGFDIIKAGMHFQNLEIEYLFRMFSLYSEKVSKIFAAISRILGINNFNIRYYAGQTSIIARKV